MTSIRKVTVINSEGLHLRPAHQLAALAGKFASEIELVFGNDAVDCKSILSVVTLGAVCGTELIVRAVGDDAETAVEAIAALFADRFGLADADTG